MSRSLRGVTCCLLLLTSCDTNRLTSEAGAAAIEAHHGRACQVVDVELGHGAYLASAFFVDEPDLRFTATFAREGHRLLRTDYAQRHWRAAYREWAASALSERFERFVHDVSFYSSLESEGDPKAIRSFREITRSREASNRTELRLYLFEEPTEALWVAVRSLLEAHGELHLEGTSLQLNLYDPEFFAGKDLQSFRYGFKSTGERFFESRHFEQLDGQLLFTLDRDDPVPSAAELSSAVNPSPNRFVVRPHHF